MPSRLSRLSVVQRYLAALACVGLAMLARWLLGPSLGIRIPYLLQIIMVLVSARWLGLGPAVAVCCSALYLSYTPSRRARSPRRRAPGSELSFTRSSHTR